VRDQRPLVIEHRVTTRWAKLGVDKGLVVRWWVEADPKHGGIPECSEVAAAVERVERLVLGTITYFDPETVEALARALLEKLPAANSVEVCDARGSGTAAHRDWP